MSSELIIGAENLGKCYQIYDQPRDRLLQMLFRGKRQYYREFWALRDISLEISRGEVLGIVGRNGAGKSTLLQLICGVLAPSTGDIVVRGRVAALLELGAGFNPEFTGRENLSLSCAVMGLSEKEIEAKYDEIVAFSGIGDFIDQPVKTYSSGMYVRLAFSVATRVDPDILVIDEALSVGDGEFARKSFDRIMELRDRGVTILFCSHSMYHIEAICNRAIWLESGHLKLTGKPSEVTVAYSTALAPSLWQDFEGFKTRQEDSSGGGEVFSASAVARISAIRATADGVSGQHLVLKSMESDLAIQVEFVTDPSLPPPALAIAVFTKEGQAVTSAGSLYDKMVFTLAPGGRGLAELVFQRIPLLKGEYIVNVFLACERLLHIYDYAEGYITLTVVQAGFEQGVAVFPHYWRNLAASGPQSGTAQSPTEGDPAQGFCRETE